MSNLTRSQNRPIECRHSIRGTRCKECYSRTKTDDNSYFLSFIAMALIMALVYFGLVVLTPSTSATFIG